jgi:hypothetical protein
MLKQLVKKTTTVAAFGLLIGSGFAAEVSQQGIISNSGLEVWEVRKGTHNPAKSPALQDNMIPSEWNVSMHTYEKDLKVTGALSKDTAVKHSGESSARIDNATTTDITELVRWNLTVKPNTTYKLTAWFKGQDIQLNKPNAPGAAIWVAAGPSKGFWGDKKGAAKFMKKGGTFDWTPLSCQFTSRENDEQMLINIQLRRGKGTLWIDDIEAVEVPAAVNP